MFNRPVFGEIRSNLNNRSNRNISFNSSSEDEKFNDENLFFNNENIHDNRDIENDNNSISDILIEKTNNDIAGIIMERHNELIIREKYTRCLNELIQCYERDEIIFIRHSDTFNKRVHVVNFKNRNTGLLMLFPIREHVIRYDNGVYGFNNYVAGIIIEKDL